MNPESFISKTTKKAFKKSINVYYNNDYVDNGDYYNTMLKTKQNSALSEHFNKIKHLIFFTLLE